MKGIEIFKDRLTQIEENIFEVEGLRRGDYDAQAVQYDRLISNGIYNRIMWGNSPGNYESFCRKALQDNDNRTIADIGCGTLSFTHSVYAENHSKDLFLCDLSYEMLKIGKNRIEKKRPDLTGITFLRSNALEMPFREEVLDTVLSFGILHIFETPSDLLKEFRRIVKPGGRIYLTSLCTDRKFSARYLNLLEKKGHVAKPLSSGEIRGLIEENGFVVDEFRTRGGMVYVNGIRKAGK